MSRLTDAEFIYAPSQIALAAFYLASEELAEQWARAKGLGQSGLDVIKEVASMISQEGGGINVEQVREVDRRLRLCKNPEKIPGTKACVPPSSILNLSRSYLLSRYAKRLEASEAASAEKRAKKTAAETDPKGMEVDVFGSSAIKDVSMHGASSAEED